METPEQITKFLIGKSPEDVTRLFELYEREAMHAKLDGEKDAAEQAEQFASESTDNLVRRLSGLRGTDKKKERAAVDSELAKRDQEITKSVMVKKIFNRIKDGPVNMRYLEMEARDCGYTGDLVQLSNSVLKIMQEVEANT